MLFAAINGLLLSSIFLVYTKTSITGTFVACAAMFAVMSLYGMFTKTDLTRLGKILYMALIGLIVATIVNIFVATSIFSWIVSYAGVAIFAGLTAYDTQRLQAMAVQTQGDHGHWRHACPSTAPWSCISISSTCSCSSCGSWATDSNDWTYESQNKLAIFIWPPVIHRGLID